MAPRICVDFDGVLTADAVAARDFIEEALGNGCKVYVHSERCENAYGRSVICLWLLDVLDVDLAKRVVISEHKPRADIYIDDKGFRFTGEFPSMEDIFKSEVCEENSRA